ncbi:unnamed protein product [Effrenium voratum]|uniref:Protein NO VEIN C-terminal domain-containing protein n=1 Tax=Effrenium voratum TaxID=2562239 RepID=A0AA36HYI4_9DINO|nr:unnamed protein product [Effrenium voratum]
MIGRVGLVQVPPSCGITPQSARPDAQDEELLEDLLLLSKSKSAEDAEEDHGWWSTVLLAALRFCPAPAALASATTVRLPRGLAPLQAQEAVDLSRLARLLQRACLRGDPGQKDAPRIRLGGTFGFGWLSVPELLGVLGSPEAAKAARKEVQAVAMESARTGVFEQKTAQIHHFAMLKWAGADWSEQSDAGRTPLHALCAGACTRTCVGGGGRAAPLRGGAWGAKARYLARDAGEWHASVDEHGLSPLNYVLPPIKPTCNCVGTVDWELIQSLMSFLWLQFDPHRIQHQAMQALSAPINAFSCIIAVMNTQLSWIDMPNDGGSLEVDPTVQSEECMEQDYISTMLDGGEGRASTPSSVDAFSCALVECRMNFAEARVRCRRYLEPMVRLQLLRAAAKQRQWQGASGKKRCEQLLVEGRERWKLRKEDLERRIWRLEMELVQTIALPPPVTSSPSKVEAPQEVQVTEAEWQPPARAAAEALVQRLRRQRLVEVEPGACPKSVEQTKVALSAAVDRLARDLYELEGHFVFELVQNADDNTYDHGVKGELQMSLCEEGGRQFFLSRNNERGLRDSDVVAMCDINASLKKSGCIGKKGIGWKSTFAVSNTPHVLSGAYTFKFDIAGPLETLGYVTPTWLTDKDLTELPAQVREAHAHGGTVIYLPLHAGFSGTVDAFDQLCEHRVTLLFLKQLHRIHFHYPDGKKVLIQREAETQEGHCVSVKSADSRSLEEHRHFAIHHFSLPKEEESAEQISIRLAFPLETEAFSAMAVHVGLPVRPVGFGFAIDAPFDLVASRADLHEGSALNQLICKNIPKAFQEFMAGHWLSHKAMMLLGTEVVPRPIWQHVRRELVEALTQVPCVETESGTLEPPKRCLARPKAPLARQASKLIPLELLLASCDRHFADAKGLEVLDLSHWVKVLQYRGGAWREGLVAQATQWENPCDFFVPLCSWLELELKESEQPSELLQQLWEVDLLPGFRVPTLRLSGGPIFTRPCLKVRADWQGILSEAGLLRVLSPKLRLVLQTTTPFLLDSLTCNMSRAELAACCVQWHLTRFEGLHLFAKELPLKAVLASLACLKETFLAEEMPDGLEADTHEARMQKWRALGQKLWVPSWNKIFTLKRPRKLRNIFCLGVAVVDNNQECADGLVLAEVSKKTWGQDFLGWEAFFDAIGVAPLDPGQARGAALQHRHIIFDRLGKNLCSHEWWHSVVKLGAPVLSYVARRCEGTWLRALPVKVDACGMVARLSVGAKERSLQKVCLGDFFLHEEFSRFGGPYLRYVRMPEIDSTSAPVVRDCLGGCGVQVRLTVPALVRCLQLLRYENCCSHLEVFADVYKEITSLSNSEEDREALEEVREELTELVFVPGGFRKLAECTWDEDKDFQWLTQVPALQVHYQRYGPMLRRYFLDLLQLPEKHPGFRPPDLLLALKALTEQVEKALADKSASLLDSLHDLASRIYGGLAQACRMNSVTWHAEVRRGFTAERLLLIPDTSQVGPRQRPKRLFTKEAWWDLEPELQTTKAHGLSLRPLYESVPDAEFFFLRVVGLRKVCSRADVAIRLKASMGSEKAFSNWSEGIDVNDLEELEDIQTSSFFRPPGWRAVGEEEEQAAQAPAPPPAFQPPPATSARVPAWRSAASAQDAQNRAERALEEERQRKAQGQRQAQPAPAHPTPAVAGPAARPAVGPAARSARHRFAWREPRRQAESETQTRPSLPNADPRPAAPRPADPRPADPRPEERSDPRPEPREAPAEPRRRRATWSQLRAQQEEQKQAKTEERPAAEPEPAAATSSQKPRSTCISAWSPRSPAAKLEVNGSETTTGPSSEGQADAADAADGSVRGSETTDAPPESAELVRRLAELRCRAQQRRSEVEDLRQECRTVEDTTQRYLRILKEFYDNM